MKNKITLKEFFDSKKGLAIHCDTEEKANALLREFDKLGEKWCTRTSYLQRNNFNKYKDKTCYTNDGAFCEIEFYKEENYKIYSFEDIIFEEDKPKNLIPEIAKMRGVEIGEEFRIIGNDGYVYFLSDLLLLRRFKNGKYSTDYVGFNQLVNGEFTIQKLPKKPQLTDAERVILENLPKKYKWIARDGDKDLYIFKNEPYKSEFSWHDKYIPHIDVNIFKHLFKFIKWDDQEPYNIEELLKGE